MAVDPREVDAIGIKIHDVPGIGVSRMVGVDELRSWLDRLPDGDIVRLWPGEDPPRAYDYPDGKLQFPHTRLVVDYGLLRLGNMDTGRPIEVTEKEFGIVSTLARTPDVLRTRRQILSDVWGLVSPELDLHIVDVHVSNARRKLMEGSLSPKILQTVRGSGFALRSVLDDSPYAQ